MVKALVLPTYANKAKRVENFILLFFVNPAAISTVCA
jgi:hypothetical protein